jgi:hypothetical protein
MGWPLSQDYNEAIQSPATHFADPDLQRGKAATNALGLPMPCSGKFADVYRLRCPGGEWAVKCFTRDAPCLRERYAAISAQLRQADLPFMVDFQYLDPGIRVVGAWYPVVKMLWAEGVPLNAFVRDNLDKAAVLHELLGIWVGMARRLRAAGIAHGDLQHRNVLAVSGGPGDRLKLRLIGYDGMFAPALAGMRSGVAGHPNYQHPQRIREGTYGPEADRFSLLAVAAALRCLEVGGRQLWDRYDTGDNLLFRQADFTAPDKSPLFAELLEFPDPEARTVAARLMAAAQRPLEETPLLEEVFSEHPAPAVAPAGAAQDPQEQTPRLEPAQAWREQRPWWEDALNGGSKPDAPVPGFEGSKQPPWWEGAAAPRAADPNGPPVQFAPPAAPPPVEEPPPAMPAAAPPASQPDEGLVARQESASAGYGWHPDYQGNLEKKSTGALVFAWALLVALVVGGVVFWRVHSETESPSTEEKALPVAANKPPHPPANGHGKANGQGKEHRKPADGANGVKPDGKKEEPPKKVPGAEQRALTCAELWEKKRKDLWGKVVSVTGRVTQEGTTNFVISQTWKVKSEVSFVGLGDNGKGKPQVFCVFQGRPDLAAAVGKSCRIEGTYRETIKHLGDDVPLLIDCKLPQDP